ncbi:MAG TPA: hypothetical protein VHL77_10455 [Ferruginibacter sp.]|nr:hypothetical protein [Ferruginibacter sp.]
MAEYKIVPFMAQIARGTSIALVAEQMQKMVDAQVSAGWEYMHIDSVQTSVVGTDGCFGIGATPGFMTSYNVLVFRKP